MEEIKYRYIIIDVLSDEIVAIKSLRDISDFIGNIYPETPLSHNTISQKLKCGNYFFFNELIIKKLIW